MFSRGASKKELISYFQNINNNMKELNEVSIHVGGDDKFNQHIQIWYQPVKLFIGRNPDAGTLHEWAKRVNEKVAKIDRLEISVTFHDLDGDYRSFKHTVIGNANSLNTILDLLEIQSQLHLS